MLLSEHRHRPRPRSSRRDPPGRRERVQHRPSAAHPRRGPGSRWPRLPAPLPSSAPSTTARRSWLPHSPATPTTPISAQAASSPRPPVRSGAEPAARAPSPALAGAEPRRSTKPSASPFRTLSIPSVRSAGLAGAVAYGTGQPRHPSRPPAPAPSEARRSSSSSRPTARTRLACSRTCDTSKPS